MEISMDWWPFPANFPIDGNWFLASVGWAEPGEAHAYLASGGLSTPALILPSALSAEPVAAG
jgi:hypothetical protein